MTPLHWAVARGHKECVELLLKHGANTEMRSKFDKTPMEIASDNHRPDLFEMLEVRKKSIFLNYNQRHVFFFQNAESYRQAPVFEGVSDPVTLAATDSITEKNDNAFDEHILGLGESINLIENDRLRIKGFFSCSVSHDVEVSPVQPGGTGCHQAPRVQGHPVPPGGQRGHHQDPRILQEL